MKNSDSMGIPDYARGYDDFKGHVARTYSDSRPSWPQEKVAPEGAPNVIVMLVDDMGYADIAPFGSEISTPNLDRLAAAGVRMTNYHTSPVCSPARAALLTGLNSHRAGFSTVAGFDPGFPGSTFEIAEDVVTLPESLRESGYATFMVGKWHLTGEFATHDGADKSSWPCQRGFDRYYGCLEGFTPFMAPNRLISDNSPVEVERYPDDYYLTDDLTDKALGMVRSLRSHDQKKPFFLYFAHHAMHAPFAAKPEDIAKYRGRYSEGWDRIRDERFARQKELGIVEAGTKLPRRNFEGPTADVLPWDEIPANEQEKTARIMEVYAAMLDNLDQNLGRLLDMLEEYGELENTLIIFTSDNGGANDGGQLGTRSYLANFLSFMGALPEDWTSDSEIDLDLIGGPQAMLQYPRGWAMASNTPFRLYKGYTFAGGVRTPMIIHWPKGIAKNSNDDGIRRQYAYVADVAPTILDAVGVTAPTTRKGQPVQEIDGMSFLPIVEGSSIEAPRSEQYSEWNGHRGMYRDGWKALTNHGRGQPYEESEWQLYHVAEDPTEIDNVAAQFPEKLAELSEAWEKEAWRNTVFPLEDGKGFLMGVHRPSTDALFEPLRLYNGTPQLERNRSAALIRAKSFEAIADFSFASGEEGVLFAHGDQNGGYVLYLEGGDLRFDYNEYGVLHQTSAGSLTPGSHVVSLAAQWRPGMRWDFNLSIDGAKPVNLLSNVQMMVGLAPFTGIDVGIDRGGPVSWPMHEKHRAFKFTGKLHHVTFVPGELADFNREEYFRAWRDAAPTFD